MFATSFFDSPFSTFDTIFDRGFNSYSPFDSFFEDPFFSSPFSSYRAMTPMITRPSYTLVRPIPASSKTSFALQNSVKTLPDGSRIESTTRSINGYNCTETTKTLADGSVETHRNYQNMTNEEVAKFEDAWNKLHRPAEKSIEAPKTEPAAIEAPKEAETIVSDEPEDMAEATPAIADTEAAL